MTKQELIDKIQLLEARATRLSGAEKTFILNDISNLKIKLPDYHRTSASFNNRAGIAGV